MGMNTTIVLLNDGLDSIAKEKDLGEKIASAVRHLAVDPRPQAVSAGNHANPLYVVETHHADHYRPILVGANHGIPLDCSIFWDGPDHELDLLQKLAAKRGYRLVKRKEKP